MTAEQLGGIVRAIMAVVGGWLVNSGYVDGHQAELIGGAAVAVVVAVWSVLAKRPVADDVRLNLPGLAAVAALALALVVSACAPVAPTPAPGAVPPATIADRTTIDETLLELAAKSVRAAALSTRALVAAGAIEPGSPPALRLAAALDAARDGVIAAQTARTAHDAAGYLAALQQANAAAGAVAQIIANRE